MSLSKNWNLQVSNSVLKFIKKISPRDTEAILYTIRLLPANPYLNDIKKMKGKDDVWRRRVGSYRIFYKIKNAERIILVFHVERRTSKTY